ncbi:hypothetical protein Nepgr_021074 [Nepenthes gracilis]|uniref:BHLH domain-containing protein n=1 Tax=Nepenthes gracilis TaxID=150966 RepID=A0AAD3SW87_NEPGR|nr:hypothetical protein Nepgr_021074 [Nepenthes gracilis]
MEFTDSDHDAGNDRGKEDGKYKSKNLKAERLRREKINDRLLKLRSLVPIITNMKKATILCDAIDYITEMQRQVRDLSEQLLELDQAINSRVEMRSISEKNNDAEEMKKWGIKPDVKVIQTDYNKLWIKLIYEKKRGRLTKLVEAVSHYGYEFTDTCVTTSKGAAILTSCLEGIPGVRLLIDEIREMLLNTIISI